METNKLYTLKFDFNSKYKTHSSELCYDFLNENNQAIATGIINSDVEEIGEKKKKKLNLELNTCNEVKNFLVNYPLRNRPYFKVFNKRNVHNLSIGSYVFDEVQDDFYLNLFDWSSKDIIGAACISNIVIVEPQFKNVNKQDKVEIIPKHILSSTKSKLNFDSASIWYKSQKLIEYTSCKFSKNGNLVVAGTSTGVIEVWDLETLSISTKIKCHMQRVGVLDWLPETNGPLLTSGSRDKSIIVSDLRSPAPAIEWTRHKQEVCGLAWNSFEENKIIKKNSLSKNNLYGTIHNKSTIDSTHMNKNYDTDIDKLIDEKCIEVIENDYRVTAYSERQKLEESCYDIYDILQNCCDFSDNYRISKPLLASGGNDNKVFIWELGYSVPIIRLVDHTAAIKAIAWAPLNYPLLATGGGTNDRSIRIWDTPKRLAIGCCESESQVCNLHWSPITLELISTHGYTLNQVNIWNISEKLDINKKLRLNKLATLSGHSSRALFMCTNKDYKYIGTAAGDAKLNIWSPYT